MSFKSSRCPADHPSAGRCGLAAGHAGDHKTLSLSSGLFVQWSKQTAKDFGDDDFQNRPKTRRAEPLKAWRWWVVGRRGILSSITSGSEWLSPVMTTMKLADGTLARVALDNPITHGWRSNRHRNYEDYGVYSYKTPRLLLTNAGYSQFRGTEGTFVLGKVDLFGHVIEHQLGYRSQKAVIQSIWVFYKDTKLIFNTPWRKALEDRYECDVEFVPFSKLESWADFYSLDPLEPENDDRD